MKIAFSILKFSSTKNVKSRNFRRSQNPVRVGRHIRSCVERSDSNGSSGVAVDTVGGIADGDSIRVSSIAGTNSGECESKIDGRLWRTVGAINCSGGRNRAEHGFVRCGAVAQLTEITLNGNRGGIASRSGEDLARIAANRARTVAVRSTDGEKRAVSRRDREIRTT